MMPSVLNTNHIFSVLKCSWCTKDTDCIDRTRNDQERS